MVGVPDTGAAGCVVCVTGGLVVVVGAALVGAALVVVAVFCQPSKRRLNTMNTANAIIKNFFNFSSPSHVNWLNY